MQEEKPTRSRIMFFSNSKHVYPGTGASEHLTEEDRLSGCFDALYAIEDFRQKLSNFYPLEGGLWCADKHWRTVEHCFQGRKFEEDFPDYAAKFALESGSALSQDDGANARKAGGRKHMPLDQDQRQRWEVRKGQVMREALYAKFTQFPELQVILLATQDAELVHRPPRSQLMIEYNLMQVRTQIQEEASSNS